MTNEVNFESLVGQTLSFASIKKGSESASFTTVSGQKYKMFHEQDCCEGVSIEDVCGDIEDILHTPILAATEVSNSDPLPGQEASESFTWTFYCISTIKGSVNIRWYGESNGYYSESVSFKKVG